MPGTVEFYPWTRGKKFSTIIFVNTFLLIVLAHTYARTYLLIGGLQKEDLQNEKSPGGGRKRKKPGSALFSPLPGIPSPLRCLTAGFGMGPGVPTVPSPPDSFLSPYVPWKPDLTLHVPSLRWLLCIAPDLACSIHQRWILSEIKSSGY